MKYPMSIKLLTKERAAKVQAMQDSGVNMSQYLRKCIDDYSLDLKKQKEVA